MFRLTKVWLQGTNTSPRSHGRRGVIVSFLILTLPIAIADFNLENGFITLSILHRCDRHNFTLLDDIMDPIGLYQCIMKIMKRLCRGNLIRPTKGFIPLREIIEGDEFVPCSIDFSVVFEREVIVWIRVSIHQGA